MPLSDFIALDLGPMEPSAITASQSLDRFATVAFGVEVIRAMIDFDWDMSKPWVARVPPEFRGPRNRLNLGVWLHTSVPACYRPAVEPIAQRVGEEFIGHKLDEWFVDRFAHRLSAVVANEIEPIYPEVP